MHVLHVLSGFFGFLHSILSFSQCRRWKPKGPFWEHGQGLRGGEQEEGRGGEGQKTSKRESRARAGQTKTGGLRLLHANRSKSIDSNSYCLFFVVLQEERIKEEEPPQAAADDEPEYDMPPEFPQHMPEIRESLEPEVRPWLSLHLGPASLEVQIRRVVMLLCEGLSQFTGSQRILQMCTSKCTLL